MTTLYLATSHEENRTPYKFKITDICVYSLEEAAWYVHNYWRESGDDFPSDEFIGWVRDALRLPFYVSKLTEISKEQALSSRVIGFLSLFELYGEAELAPLRSELSEWETRQLWERLKENADSLYRQGRPESALLLYRQALSHTENYKILNNCAAALMKLYRFDEASALLTRAAALEPANPQILLALAESSILAHNFDLARSTLAAAEALEPHGSGVSYMHGLLALTNGDPHRAVTYFRKALDIEYNPNYIYSLAQTYIKLRDYINAEEVLKALPHKDSAYYTIRANLHKLTDNIPAALLDIEHALLLNGTDANLWATLASYHRQNHDLPNAERVINKALSLDPANSRARFEQARINNALGHTREYQAALSKILDEFKANFRQGN